MQLESGTFVTPKVRLIAQLGGGGMGSVWLANHLGLQSRVVVKLMSPTLVNSAESRERFSREAAAAALVRSPHSVHVYDHGVTDEGTPYIVMESLEGEDLGRLLARRRRLTLGETAVIVAHTAKALQRAHERGVIHRDIKPENIFLRDVGNDELFAMVLDFGIAKTRDQLLSKLTKTGIMMGTPYYMSPEQLILNKPVDHHADAWSLAVVAFEAITGELPFPGATAPVVGMAMMGAPRPVPSTHVGGIPPAVDAWFERAFAAQPHQRFESVREMAKALLDATRTRLSSPPSSIGETHEAPRVSRPAETRAFEGLPAPSAPVKSAPLLETQAYEPPNTTQALPAMKVAAAVARAASVPTTKWEIEPERPPEPDTFDLPLPGVLKRPLPPAPVAATRRLLAQETERRIRVDTDDVEELEFDEELPPLPIAAPVSMPLPMPMPIVMLEPDERLPLRPRAMVLIGLALAALTLIVLLLVTTR